MATLMSPNGLWCRRETKPSRKLRGPDDLDTQCDWGHNMLHKWPNRKRSWGFTPLLSPERDWTGEILPLLNTYRQEFGHCIIEQGFKVPSCRPWPTKAWGMSLGKVVNRIRVDAAYVEQVARDKDIVATTDFVWNRDEAVWNQQIIPGIRG
ncbi:hypothetical protein JG688_00014051 [Phytophthora aleatoria]|uniref:Uncharacterized protein n=1 Tax=Phytophthora aleatoria TaxID=2496075 RepID=A0A8J5IGH9_9STRA|nr:hypothetical protein JG688_00014051 [Phytophthora aleatoria]